MPPVTRCQILRLKCTKFDFGWGSAPYPTGEAYSAPPDPLAGFKDLLLSRGKGGEGKGREGKGSGKRKREGGTTGQRRKEERGHGWEVKFRGLGGEKGKG